MPRRLIRNHEAPRRLGSLSEHELENNLLLFCRDTQRVQLLNASARAVWELCDGERTVLQINRTLARELGVSHAALYPDVQWALNELLNAGMLGIAPDATPLRYEPTPERAGEAVLQIGFGGYAIEVRSDIAAALTHLHQRFAFLATTEGDALLPPLRLLAAGQQVRLEDGRRAVEGNLNDMLQEAESEIIQRLMDARADLLWLHAAAVQGAHGAVMIAGASGAGKSSFSTLLLKAGHAFYSDDILPVAMSARQALPFPLTPRVRLTGAPVPAHRLQEVARQTMELRASALRDTPAAITGLVLPLYVPGVGAQLVRGEPAQVAQCLIENTVNLPVHGDTAVGFLCELARTLPAVVLRYSDRAAGLRLLAAVPWLSDLASPAPVRTVGDGESPFAVLPEAVASGN